MKTIIIFFILIIQSIDANNTDLLKEIRAIQDNVSQEQRDRRNKLNGTVVGMPDEMNRAEKIEYILYFIDSLEASIKVTKFIKKKYQKASIRYLSFALTDADTELFLKWQTEITQINSSFDLFLKHSNTLIIKSKALDLYHLDIEQLNQEFLKLFIIFNGSRGHLNNFLKILNNLPKENDSLLDAIM